MTIKTKKAAVEPLKSVIAITIEQIPTAYHSDKRPQGDNAPYDNCQPLSNTHRVEDLFGYKDTNNSINNLKKLINNWNISDEKSFVYIVANCIGAEPSIERQKRANKAEEISYYLNLPQYSLRIGLHNLNAENYTGVRNRPMNHGVTLKDLRKKDTFKAKKGVKVNEYVYIYWTEQRLKNIAKAILHLLETGVWDKTIAEPDYTNPKPDINKPISGIPSTTNFKTLLVNILSQNGYINGKDYKIRYFKSSPYRANRGEKNVQECWLTVRNAPSNIPIQEDDWDDIESLTDYVCGAVDSHYYDKKTAKQATTFHVGDLICYKGVEESVFKIVATKGNNYLVVEIGDRTKTENKIPFADNDKLQRAVSPLLITEAKLAKTETTKKIAKTSSNSLKMSDEDRQYFSNTKLSERDFKQMEDAVQYTTFERNGRKISAKTTIETLGRERFWWGMCRSAFHQSACVGDKEPYIYFDSSKYFSINGISGTSENLIQDFQENIWKNGFNSVTLRQLDNIIDDIQNGRITYFNTGRNGRGDFKRRSQRLVIGSAVLCGAGNRYGIKAREFLDSERSWRYKELIEQWARLKGVWYTDSVFDDLKKKGFKYLIKPNDKRSHVEADVFTNGKIVVKIIKTIMYPNNIVDAISRFVIHNQLFGDSTRIDILGFGKIKNEFRFIVQQPYIHGDSATSEETESYLRSRIEYLTKDDDISYHTTDFIIGDLHSGNVLKSEKTGQIYIIDAFLKFNNNELDGISDSTKNLSGILKPIYYDFDNEDDGNDYGKSRTATKELLKDVKAFAKRLKADLGLEDYYYKNKNRTVETNHTECNVHFVVPQAKAPENHLHIRFYVNHPLRGVNYDYQLDEWFPISLGEEHSFGDTYRCSINQTYDEILRDIRIRYPIFRIKKASSGNAEMQSAEYEIVLQAREIAQNGESLRQRFDRLVDLYNNQRTIKPTDTKSKLLQQYSTPCPLAFLASEYVKQNAAERYYIEPSAGNGMLTISLPVNHTVVNEIDEVRLENLKKQGFADCMSKDASKPICAPHLFDGVITNPPFKSLPKEEQITENGFTLATLDYKMACAALDMMRNDGRAAVIVGGKMFDNYWKPLKNTDKNVLFGQWKIFLGWLYAAYNVEDLIYIGGDYIYRKQGTTYPVVLILIDGRRVPFSTKNKPDYIYDPIKNKIITTYDELFDRVAPSIQRAHLRVNSSLLVSEAKLAKTKN